MPIVIYGYETWSLTLSEECRPREFEKRVLRRISRIKMDENEEGRRLHNEEIHSLCRSGSIVRVINFKRLRRVGYVAIVEETKSVFRMLIGKSTGKRTRERPMRKWKYNI